MRGLIRIPLYIVPRQFGIVRLLYFILDSVSTSMLLFYSSIVALPTCHQKDSRFLKSNKQNKFRRKSQMGLPIKKKIDMLTPRPCRQLLFSFEPNLFSEQMQQQRQHRWWQQHRHQQRQPFFYKKNLFIANHFCTQRMYMYRRFR